MYPLFAIVGAVGVGASYFVWHTAMSPVVVWRRYANPEPWRSIKPDEHTKFMDVTGKMKPWRRDGF